MRNLYQHWEVSYSLFLELLYSGQHWGSFEMQLQVLWCFDVLGSLSHTIQAKQPRRGQTQRLLGTKGQLSLPQWLIHPTDRLGEEMRHVEHAGTCMEHGDSGHSYDLLYALNCQSCQNGARKKKIQDYRNTNKSLDLNTKMTSWPKIFNVKYHIADFSPVPEFDKRSFLHAQQRRLNAH